MSNGVQAGNRRRTSGRVTPSKLRRNVVIAVDGVLALGTGALGGLFATGTASAAPPTTGWTGLQAPLPSAPDAPSTNPGVNLSSESCSSAVNCVAVGSYNGAGERGLLDTFAGGSWSATESPLPGDAITDPPSVMESVSCPTDGSCVAAGIYETGSHGTAAVLDTLSNGHWSATEAPLPSNAASGSNERAFLKSVDCTGAGSCTAIGSYKDTSGHTAGFIDTLSGGQWSSQTAPQPAGANTDNVSELVGVSCPASGSCSVVGLYENASGHAQAEIIQQASNGTWSAQDAPLPGNAASGSSEQSVLLGVSCSAGVCEAAGAYDDTSGKTRALLESLSGAGWTTSEGPQPGDAAAEPSQNSSLQAVSCTFDGCAAVGSYANAAGGTSALIDSVTPAGVATATAGPLPSDTATGSSTNASLRAVSCLSMEECDAVGSYHNSSGSGNPVALLDASSAGSWSNEVVPLPVERRHREQCQLDPQHRVLFVARCL